MTSPTKRPLKDEKYRDNVNGPWEKMFPDPHDRPARHALKVDLRGKVLFQIEVIAVLERALCARFQPFQSFKTFKAFSDSEVIRRFERLELLERLERKNAKLVVRFTLDKRL